MTTIALIAVTLVAQPPASLVAAPQRDAYDAIIRGHVDSKQLALIFTGDEHGESTSHILDALKQRSVKASFFVTGNFLGNVQFRREQRRIIAEGHYLGPHSNAHPLYSPWDDREKSLVTEEFFSEDLRTNIADLRKLGAPPAGKPIYFIPPYEWHNRQHVTWARKLGVTLVNFTPGSGSNRDYAPEGDRRFVPSKKIFRDILAYEKNAEHRLNGFLLLMHLGSGRKDPFHPMLGPMCDELHKRDYELVRIDELLKSP